MLSMRRSMLLARCLPVAMLGIVITAYSVAADTREGSLQIAQQIHDRQSMGDGYPTKESKSRPPTAEQALQQGIEHYARDEFQAAITDWQTALDLYQTLGDRNKEASVYRRLGIAYRRLEQYDLALENHRQALAIAQEIGSRFEEGAAYNNIGVVYENTFQFDLALEYYQKALAIAQEIDNRNSESLYLENIGDVYGRLSQYDQALEFYQQALSIAQEIENRSREGFIYADLGDVYEGLQQYALALEFNQKSLAIAQELNNKALARRTHKNLGDTYAQLGEYDQSVVSYQQALAIAQELENRLEEGNIYSALGNVYRALGQYERSIELLQQALVIVQETNNEVEEVDIYFTLGDVYSALGQADRAIESYQRGLVVFQELIVQVQETGGQDVGGIISTDEADRVVEASLQLLESFQELYDQIGEDIDSISPISNPFGNSFFPQLDDESLQQIAEIVSGIQSTREETDIWGVGNIYFLQGQYAKALESFQQELALVRENGDRNSESAIHSGLGNTYIVLEQYDLAIESYQEALKIAKELGNSAEEGAIYSNLGLAYYNLGQLQEATQSWLDSIQVLETLRPELLEDTNQLSLLDSQLVVYTALQSVLVAQAQSGKALEISERSRAQALKLQLASNLPARQTALGVDNPNIEAIRQIAQQQKATLVSYTVLWNGEVLIWVIQPDGTLTTRRSTGASAEDIELFQTLNNGRGQAVPETPLQELVRGSGGSFTQVADLNLALEQLYTALIAPIEDVLPSDVDDSVIFIPHKELFQVPFAALRHPTTKQYLIEHHTVSTAPSILSLALTEERQTQLEGAGSGALIVGNPDISAQLADAHGLAPLPGAEQEAQQIATLLNAAPEDVLLQEAATEEAVIDRLHTAKYIHLATHGLLLDTPAYSTLPGLLALTPSTSDERGEFTAEEIVELTQTQKLVADLVVLSACRTGQGQITSDGAYGLSRAFLTGGTPSLIVSLWDVPDDATQLLMTEFYSYLLGASGGVQLDKAQALRQAMLTTMNHDRGQYRNDPRYWAAFTLIGQPD